MISRNSYNLIVLFLGLIGCTPALSSDYPHANQAKPLNVLFIIADDLRADALNFGDNPYILTPNIRNLADNGIRFTNCYVMGGHHGAICAPSRAMLMSGKQLFRVYDKLDGVYTMPQHFAKHGYKTFGTGKWHNGAESFIASFQHGKNVFLGGMCDHFKVPCRDLLPEKKLSLPTEKGYSTDVFTDAAIDFISGYANGQDKAPFFCYLAYTAPHDPRSPRDTAQFLGKQPYIPLPGNFMSAHPFDHGDLQIRDEHLAAWPRNPEKIRESLADYYAMIAHLDERIGDLINTLKKYDLYDNTLIVFTADNGLAVGSHGLLGKQNLYEHSMKVPLVLHGPGVPGNQTTKSLVYLFDLFPTLSSLSGLPIPNDVDGKNLTSIIKNPAASVRDVIFTAYRHTIRAVRTREWKLIRYPERNFTQLFNLNDDPLELHNLAVDEDYQIKVNEMTALLKTYQKQFNDTVDWTADKVLPLDYDYRVFKQQPDVHQPNYILNKYFR